MALFFYKIPLYPPFPKGEVKKRMLSQFLKICAPNNCLSYFMHDLKLKKVFALKPSLDGEGWERRN